MSASEVQLNLNMIWANVFNFLFIILDRMLIASIQVTSDYTKLKNSMSFKQSSSHEFDHNRLSINIKWNSMTNINYFIAYCAYN